MHVVKPTRCRAASLPPSCALAHARWPAFLSTQVSGPLNSHRWGGRGGHIYARQNLGGFGVLSLS